MFETEEPKECFKPEIQLSQGEHSSKWQSYFLNADPTFDQAMKRVLKLEDGFGLCGLVTYHIFGRQKMPKKWIHEQFVPVELKKQFDEFDSATSGKDLSPAAEFLRQRTDLIRVEPTKATTVHELMEIYSSLKDNQAMNFAIICNFSTHGGQDTHWLAILEIVDQKVVIAGDLSPLGEEEEYIAEIDLEILVAHMNLVLQSKPTTTNAHRRLKADYYSGARSSDLFTSNVGLVTLR